MSQNVHITHISDTTANLRSDMDEWQYGNITDNSDTGAGSAQDDCFSFMNASAARLYAVPSNKWIDPSTGTATYLSAEFDSVYVRANVYLDDAIIGYGDTDTKIDFTTDDAMSLYCGNVLFLYMSEDDAQKNIKWNSGNVDIDFCIGSAISDYSFQLFGDTGLIELQDASLAHGVTTVLSTQAYGRIKKFNATYGGLELIGAADGAYTGVNIKAIATGGNDGSNYCKITAYKASGTGVTDIDAADYALQVQNNGAALMNIFGNGNSHFNGNVSVGTQTVNYPFTVKSSTAGDATIAGFIADDDGLVYGFCKDANDNAYLNLYQGDGSAEVQIHASGYTYFNGGNVGIGIAVPVSGKLQITDGNRSGLSLTGTVTAVSALATNIYAEQTLSATANNDSLHGIRIGTSASVGAFTGTNLWALRIDTPTGAENNYAIFVDGGNSGFGISDPDTKVEVFYAGTQLKLSFDATDNAVFAVDTNGDLTITPSGDEVIISDNLSLLSDASVLNFGADKDVTLTHVADTGLQLALDRKLLFGDTAVHIQSDDDGHLDLTADTSVDVNGDAYISGTLGIGLTPTGGNGVLQLNLATVDLGIVDSGDTGGGTKTITGASGWIQIKQGSTTRYIATYDNMPLS